MITAVGAEMLSFLEERFGGDPFGCRVAAVLRAYGTALPFVRAWVGGPAEDPVCALLLFDGTAVLSCTEKTDWEELSAFVRMLPDAQRLLCERDVCRALGFPIAEEGPVLRFAGRCPAPEALVEENPPLREIYGVMEASYGTGFAPPPFDGFYVDLSHRIRHRTAMSAGVRAKGRLVSCGLCTAYTAQSAQISAVCTLPEERGRGYGGRTVCALVQRLRAEYPKRDICLFRAERENEAFYARLGFAPCGRWCEARLF